MLAYTLAKAVEDLNDKLGIYESYGWQYKHIKKVSYQHPLDYSPFNYFFKVERNIDGGIWKSRTDSEVSEADPLFVGSVFKSLFDLSEPTSAYFSTDSELNQSVLFGKKELENGLVEIWENNRYFRLPTKEMAE